MNLFEATQKGPASLNHLPFQMTDTIGRVDEIRLLVDLLSQSEVRLVTLTGPGGVGKTRLSLEVARRLSETFADGVFFVSLAPLRDYGQIILAIAQALQLEETAESTLEERLLAYLSNKCCLLLLDNFEHLLSCANLVTKLLNRSPRLKVLTSSREMLHLYGEREIVVPPLPLPELNVPGSIPQSSAMELFIVRAQAARPGLPLQAEQIQAIAEICVQLDGLPLAIELAAARCKILNPQAILARLDSRLRLLTGGARDLPLRQQTLRNTLDWSYELLADEEKGFFRRLGVLIGSWTCEAAEAIACPAGEDALSLVTSLVDKSLVRLSEDDPTEPRFILLETVREYALDCLERTGEEAEARHRHAAFYLTLAEEVAPLLQGAEQRTGLRRLDQEAANLRAALSWTIETRSVTASLRLASALREYLPLRSSLQEDRPWFEEVLALEVERLETVLELHDAGKASMFRARVLYGAGLIARLHSKLDLARTHLNESRQIARQIGDNLTLALALGLLAQLELYHSDYEAAHRLVEEGLQAAEVSGDIWCRGILNRVAGDVASKQCDFNQAQTRYTVSLELLRSSGDQRNAAETLISLGNMAYLRGKLKTAHYLYARALRLFQEAGDRRGQIICQNRMGEALCVQGNYLQARLYFTESSTQASRLGERAELSNALTGLGQIALCLNEIKLATRNFKEAIHLAREINYTQGHILALCGLGDLKRQQEAWTDALIYYQNARELATSGGDRLALIAILCGQGDTARALGDYSQACTCLKQSLLLAWETGNQLALTTGLESLARLCPHIGQPEQGILLLSAAQNLRENLQTLRPSLQELLYLRELEALQSDVGQVAFGQIWAEGRALPLPQVIHTEVERVQVTEIEEDTSEPAPRPYQLTARELEVLRLLAAGHTDAQIARTLVVSPRTINTHLRSIYSKIGVSTRSAATRLALEQRLV